MSERLHKARKGRPSKKPEEKALDPRIVAKLFGLMRHRLSDADLLAACEKLKVPDGLAPRYVAETKRQLTVAADYNRDEEIGRLNIRWEEFHTNAIAAKDFQSQATALKEMAKLKALYETPKPSVSGETASNDEADAVKRHLVQHNLSDEPDVPAYEIIRLAGLKLISQGVEIDRLKQRTADA